MLNVVEIMHEAQQGITRPFLCRCDDGNEYFVKRFNAGRKAQMSEWISASLAQQLGLPVAPFDIAEVPRSLLDLRTRDEQRDWGHGPVFASRVVPGAVELRFTDLLEVPLQLQASILLFDAWIGNDDRTLSCHSGNPNMLWSDLDRQVTIIDHNRAFEASAAQVLADHAFAAAKSWWDVVFTSQWPQRLVAAANTLPQVWGQIPDLWIEDCVDVLTLELVSERLQLFTDLRNPEWNTR